MEPEVLEGQVMGKPTNLQGLNEKAIQKLADLLEGLDEKSQPDMVTAVTDAVAKLNTSLKNSDILPKEETELEKRERELKESLASAMKG